MNRAIVRLFGVVLLLFAALIFWTSRATVFDQAKLNDNSLNKLAFYRSLKVKRGTIYADNGTVLASSSRADGGTWRRSYPQGPLFAQTVGYYFPQKGQQPTGLEKSYNHYLEGAPNGLSNLFGTFNGVPKVGDDVDTTLDPSGQAEARKLLAGRAGSVVAIVPQTGAVKVMYSNPTYNDNDPQHCGAGCSTFFNALQGTYPTGSTFKLITSTAALDTRKLTPESLIDGDQPLMVASRLLHNDGDQSWGEISLTTALTYSVNTAFARIGLELGGSVLQKYMERYGFYAPLPLDYPRDQMTVSGERFYKGSCGNRSNTPVLVPVTSPCVDLGRTAIGQANLAVTPMQMAMVVATIANHGKLMKPRLVSKVVNQEGQTVADGKPQVDDQVMKPKYAAELTTMMQHVVDDGTGRPANVEGLDVAGKTGTASTGAFKHGVPLDDAWFVAFPASDPKIAVAVEVSNTPEGYGAEFAAPIAAQMIKTLVAGQK